MSKDVERRRPIISIMGDRFMLPSMFEQAIREKCGEALEIRSYEMPWPDEPMEHGYAEPGMEGLKEYQGTADEVVAHMDGAEIAVTHLAPFSAGVIERLPAVEADRRLSRRSCEHRHGGGAQAEDSCRQHPRSKCVRRRRIHHRRNPRRDSAYYEEDTRACVAANGGAISIAPILPARNCRK